jgi:hypothetical protein
VCLRVFAVELNPSIKFNELRIPSRTELSSKKSPDIFPVGMYSYSLSAVMQEIVPFFEEKNKENSSLQAFTKHSIIRVELSRY